MKVLIVDDEYGIREVIKEYCLNEGYEVEEAEDGLVYSARKYKKTIQNTSNHVISSRR